jgi:hypothetical protein
LVFGISPSFDETNVPINTTNDQGMKEIRRRMAESG